MDLTLLSAPTTEGSGRLSPGLTSQTVQDFAAASVPFLLNAIGALIVLIIGLWLAGRVRKILRDRLNRSGRIDATLRSFLLSFVYYALVVLIAITALGIFGVPTTSFAAILGASGLAIGLALQGTLGHIASGIMLLTFRPFEVGQYIAAAGYEGPVRRLTLFTTELASVDNKKIIIPNSAVWAASIVNYSAYGERRLDLQFSISYSDDIEKAKAVIANIISKDERILVSPEPVIAVNNLGASSVDIICRPWVKSQDYSPVKWDLLQQVKEAFDANAITIPFPTRHHLVETSPQNGLPDNALTKTDQ